MAYHFEVKKRRDSSDAAEDVLSNTGVRSGSQVELDHFIANVAGTATASWVEVLAKASVTNPDLFIVYSNIDTVNHAVGIDLDTPTTKYHVVLAGTQRLLRLPVGCSVYLKTL